jgi:hypothetical protein
MRIKIEGIYIHIIYKAFITVIGRNIVLDGEPIGQREAERVGEALRLSDMDLTNGVVPTKPSSEPAFMSLGVLTDILDEGLPSTLDAGLLNPSIKGVPILLDGLLDGNSSCRSSRSESSPPSS